MDSDKITIKGKLIVIEGGDGSGKTAQVEALAGRLDQLGYRVKVWDFPQYGATHFGRMVGRMLHGDFGELKSIHPLMAATFFALDRLSVRDEMRQFLAEGGVGLCNRYTDSNCAHGGAKFDTIDEGVAFIAEVERLEFGELELPVPDLSLYLATDAALSRRLVLAKGEREYMGQKADLDQAERDMDHQRRAREMYEYLCQSRTRFARITCMAGEGEIDTREAIHERVLTEIQRRFVV